MMIEQTDTAIDRALSGFLAERCGLADDEREVFRRTVASLSAALRDGHTCIELDNRDRAVVAASPLVSSCGTRPLVLCGERFYLARYYGYEQSLADRLRALAGVSHPVADIDGLLDVLFSRQTTAETDWQREAARVALSKGLCIISGGPGTGKTTTVVNIVALLLVHYSGSLRIALAAPTGKAAARLRESVTHQTKLLDLEPALKEALPRQALTLHRLLGVRRFSQTFRYNRQRPLPWDVVIVDEASMVDLALMSRLVESLAPGARLILLGDRDQLASVESGAVLADCMGALQENVVELRRAWRFNEEISAFAGAVNRGDSQTVWNMLESPAASAVVLADNRWIERAVEMYGRFLEQARRANPPEDLAALFTRFARFRVLCAVRNGPFGVVGINAVIEQQLAQQGYDCGTTEWYTGRPVIVTRNDYALGLFNGDIGICLPDPENGGALAVWFEGEGGIYRRCLPVRLPACETVFAMTVHKSQGSEFSDVLVILPEEDNQVLSRELLYTAVTRAREKVRICAGREVCKTTVERRISRHSGLAEKLAGR